VLTLQAAVEIILAAGAGLLLARDLRRAWRDPLRRPVTLLVAGLMAILLIGVIGGRSHPSPWWLVVPGGILAWEVARGWRLVPRCYLREAGIGVFAVGLLLAALGLGMEQGSIVTALVAAAGALGFAAVGVRALASPRAPALACGRREPLRAPGESATEEHGMSPERTIGAVVLFIGLASLGVLAWASRTIGDFIVLGVFAAFGAGCVLLGWRLLLLPASSGGQAAQPAQPAAAARSARRVKLSHACSTAGVLLLMACALVPEHWYPVALLFIGIALLAIAHVLTPCEERLEKLRKARARTYL
jgi:hypothetical protein